MEITNACNLSCGFCHGTKRDIRYMSAEEFRIAAARLRPFADYLYFHVMGEPLLHPKLGEFFDIADRLGFRVILTTNGTLLPAKAPVLLSAKPLHKISISLHCYEANTVGISLGDYLSQCFDFCSAAAQRGIFAVMRLWNIGGEDRLNSAILDRIHSYFPGEWEKRYSGYRLADRVFLEWGERFDWPDVDGEYVGDAHSCYGLRDQIGVLSDGTVVPCCLDADGAVGLGNIFETELGEILAGERAVKLKRSIEAKRVCEELCRRCGYAAMRF